MEPILFYTESPAFRAVASAAAAEAAATRDLGSDVRNVFARETRVLRGVAEEREREQNVRRATCPERWQTE